MVLDEAFIQKCREAFNAFDVDGSGSIDIQEMRQLLEAIGEVPTEEELFRFMGDVDEGGNGEIEFVEFIKAFDKQKSGRASAEEEMDYIDTFVALGGQRDKSGNVDLAKLSKVVKDSFGLTIKLDKVIDDLDKDKDGKLTFPEFAALFT